MRTLNDEELRRRVDEVLFYVWDPIGVSDVPNARGEYDSYVPKVFELLKRNDDSSPIAAYLQRVISLNMGLVPDKEKCRYTSELLLQHKQAIQDGCA